MYYLIKFYILFLSLSFRDAINAVNNHLILLLQFTFLTYLLFSKLH